MAPILVEDDEDDVVVSSPRAHAQAKNKARVDAHRSTRATRGPAVEDPFEPRVEAHRSTRAARGLEATLDEFMEANRGRAARGEASVEEFLEANRARGPAMEDLLGIPLDPLEWRLGPGVEFTFQSQGIATGRRGRPARTTIDLTTAPARRSAPLNDDCVVLLEYTKNPRKRKPAPEEPVLVREVAPEPTPAPPPPPPASEEYRFKCVICMENLKEETSTICGHIFCGACIKGAIQAQKKCPTCRKKLNMKNIHRIYL
jgi:hypothetical protein